MPDEVPAFDYDRDEDAWAVCYDRETGESYDVPSALLERCGIGQGEAFRIVKVEENV